MFEQGSNSPQDLGEELAGLKRSVYDLAWAVYELANRMGLDVSELALEAA